VHLSSFILRNVIFPLSWTVHCATSRRTTSKNSTERERQRCIGTTKKERRRACNTSIQAVHARQISQGIQNQSTRMTRPSDRSENPQEGCVRLRRGDVALVPIHPARCSVSGAVGAGTRKDRHRRKNRNIPMQRGREAIQEMDAKGPCDTDENARQKWVRLCAARQSSEHKSVCTAASNEPAKERTRAPNVCSRTVMRPRRHQRATFTPMEHE